MIADAAKQVKDELYSQRKNLVKITGDSVCSLCNKKIGTSVFAVYPNGKTIVHFVCFKDSQNMKAVAKGSPLRKRWHSVYTQDWRKYSAPSKVASFIVWFESCRTWRPKQSSINYLWGPLYRWCSSWLSSGVSCLQALTREKKRRPF